MSNALAPPLLSPDEARRVDRTCDRFEAAWKVGGRPPPEEYLGTADGPERSALLRQLLVLDWDYRRRAGEDPRAADYHARFPGDAALIEEVGREMAESPGSTHTESDGPAARHTPWSGAGAPDARGGLGADETEPARYDLVEEVGHGGIGVVFRGRDRVLGRELAVKVLREAYQDKPDARRRFLAEARVGSQLQHPAIVPVYELGSFGDGRPFLTMRLVEGRTFAALLRDRADSGQDVPRLLGVFEQVCQAVAYAHARGVIHRDLKPANVMVGAFGEVQVMDWGFAKQLPAGDCRPPTDDGGEEPSEVGDRRFDLGHSADVTHTGSLMGTPAYMPPEQARGETALVDRRSDVFSLGAILCEILTGRPPYQEDDPDELCRKAADADLEDARARLDGCGADEALRELARRCLAAEPAARPPDAAAVAWELTAYLASAQERLRQAQLDRAAAEARAEEARAKAQAERRTRRLTIALAAAVVLLALGAVLVPTVSLVALRAEQQRTRDALTEEAQRRRTARQALDLLTGSVVEDWLLRQPELLPEHRQFLEQALRSYEEFAADTGQEEESRAGVAHAYRRVGVIRYRLGQRKEATAAWERSREFYAGLVADFPRVAAYREDLAMTNFHLGAQYSEIVGRLPDAEAALRQGLTIRRDLVDEFPGVPAYRHGLANTFHTLGIVLRRLDRPQEAEHVYGHALTHLSKLTNEFPDEPSYANDQAKVYLSLSELYVVNIGRSREAILSDPGRFREAAEAAAQAVSIHERLAARFRKERRYRVELAKSLGNQANLLSDAGQYPAAEKAFDRAVATRQQLVHEFPGVPTYKRDLAITLNNLGILYKNNNRADLAEKLYRQSLVLHKQLADDVPGVPVHQHEVAGAMVNLARLLLARKNLDGARRLLEEAVPYHQAALNANPRNPSYRFFYRNNRWRMAETLLELKDHAGAAEAAGQFLQMRVELPRDAYTAAGLLADCVRLAAQDERLPESKRRELAAAYGDRALAALRQAVETGFKDVARMKKDLTLGPLQSREDFQELLAGLEQRHKAP